MLIINLSLLKCFYGKDVPVQVLGLMKDTEREGASERNDSLQVKDFVNSLLCLQSNGNRLFFLVKLR